MRNKKNLGGRIGEKYTENLSVIRREETVRETEQQIINRTISRLIDERMERIESIDVELSKLSKEFIVNEELLKIVIENLLMLGEEVNQIFGKSVPKLFKNDIEKQKYNKFLNMYQILTKERETLVKVYKDNLSRQSELKKERKELSNVKIRGINFTLF
jgi:uncharacterized protein with HEPN domain